MTYKKRRLKIKVGDLVIARNRFWANTPDNLKADENSIELEDIVQVPKDAYSIILSIKPESNSDLMLTMVLARSLQIWTFRLSQGLRSGYWDLVDEMVDVP